MEYVLGGIAGIAYGSVVGLLKYLFLWRKIANQKDTPDSSDEASKLSMEAIGKRLFISSGINIVTLMATLIFKNSHMIDFAALAIGTAVALSLAGRIFPVKKFI